MDDLLTLTFIVLMAGLLWLTGAFLQWRNLRTQERLTEHLRRLALLQQAEFGPPTSLVGPAESDPQDNERFQPTHSWMNG